ncbi:MAG: response regulator [Bacteroidota bacterium]
MNILVAENDSEYRTVLNEALRMYGHEVRMAADGLEAFEVLERNPIDLIVSDIHMPRSSGTQFHELVRGDKRFKHIPFVYISGFAILRVATPIDDSGHDFMVSKVPFERLIQLINDIVFAGETQRRLGQAFGSH